MNQTKEYKKMLNEIYENASKRMALDGVKPTFTKKYPNKYNRIDQYKINTAKRIEDALIDPAIKHGCFRFYVYLRGVHDWSKGWVSWNELEQQTKIGFRQTLQGYCDILAEAGYLTKKGGDKCI